MRLALPQAGLGFVLRISPDAPDKDLQAGIWTRAQCFAGSLFAQNPAESKPQMFTGRRFFRDANTGAGQGFTDLTAVVQLHLRGAILADGPRVANFDSEVPALNRRELGAIPRRPTSLRSQRSESMAAAPKPCA